MLFGSVAPHGHIVRSIVLLLCTSHLYSRPRSSWKQPSEYAAFCIVSAAKDKCQTSCIDKRCNVKHNRLRGETVVVLSTGYPPQCVAYSRHAKVSAVVRTSCLQMIRVVQSKFPYFVDMLFGRHRRCATICGIILIEERRMKRHRFH